MTDKRLLDKSREVLQFFENSELPVMVVTSDLLVVDKNSAAGSCFPELKFADALRMLQLIPDTEEISRKIKNGQNVTASLTLKEKIYSVFFTPILCDNDYIGAIVTAAFLQATPSPNGREEIFSAISQSFRKPLSSLFSSLGVMEKSDFIADNFNDQLQNINNSSYDILRSCVNITEYGKIRHYPDSAPKKVFDLTVFLLDLCSAIQSITYSTDVPFTYSIPDRPVFVCGVQEWLTDAILNIVTNSIKYTREKNTVSLSMLVPPSEDVVIMVKDSGAGMAPETVGRIFEPFFTANVDGGGRQKLGLGLSVAKLAVESFGGNISVFSEKGKGTTMTIRLPRSRYDKKNLELSSTSADYLMNRYSLPYVILSDSCGYPEV